MGGNAVKTIVLLMVLVVLSILIGAQISDGLKDSIGAFGIIGAVVMLYALILLGKNAWWLVFLVTPCLALFPLHIFRGSLGTYAFAGLVLVFNLIQCVFLRQQKLTWHKLAPFDVMVFIIAIYMCISYYRFPVFLEIMSDDVEFVGAETYIHWLGSVVYFFFLSSLAIKSAELEKVLRITFWLALGVAVLNVGVRLSTGNIYWDGGGAEIGSLGDEMGEKRITLLCPIAALLIPYIYASCPVLSLMRSPVRMAGALFSLYGISLAGSRGIMVGHAVNLIGISFLKREFAVIGIMGIAMSGGIVLLSAAGALHSLPKTTQRMISIIPGTQVDREIEHDADGSSEARVAGWKMAFDVRSGYIKDYVWGDGFQLSQKEFRRVQVAAMRGIYLGQEDDIARTGNWHNGFISTMHRLGLVCCALFYTVMIYCMVLFFVVGTYYRGKAFFPYYCAHMCGLFGFAFAYSYNANVPMHFFGAIKTFCLIKLMYVLLRKEGKLAPISLQRTYVPILIQEMNDAGTEYGRSGKAPLLRGH